MVCGASEEEREGSAEDAWARGEGLDGEREEEKEGVEGAVEGDGGKGSREGCAAKVEREADLDSPVGW